MSNINCGIGVLHVKRQILTYFFVTSFLCSLLVFIVSFDRAYKEVSTKNIENFLWLSFCDMTVPSKNNIPSLWPWPLTYESQCFQWIDNDLISVRYEFQIGLLHVKRHTRQNDVKWRPIVTKFGILIENMSRTGLYVCHIFLYFYWQFYEN